MIEFYRLSKLSTCYVLQIGREKTYSDTQNLNVYKFLSVFVLTTDKMLPMFRLFFNVDGKVGGRGYFWWQPTGGGGTPI